LQIPDEENSVTDSPHDEPSDAVKYLCVAVLATTVFLAGQVQVASSASIDAQTKETLSAKQVERIVSRERFRAIAVACGSLLVGFILTILLWKRSQRARAAALLVMLAVFVGAANAVWDCLFGGQRAQAPILLSVLSVAMLAASIASIAFLLAPAVRRQFVGDLSDLARARREGEEIWGLESEIQRRKEEGKG